MHLSDNLRIKMAKSNLKKTEAVVIRDQGRLDYETMEESEKVDTSIDSVVSATVSDLFLSELPSLKVFKGLAEKRYLEELLTRYSGETSVILGVSGLSRSHFYALLKKYEISY
jgi:two-component system NtrC family response regulator